MLTLNRRGEEARKGLSEDVLQRWGFGAGSRSAGRRQGAGARASGGNECGGARRTQCACQGGGGGTETTGAKRAHEYGADAAATGREVDEDSGDEGADKAGPPVSESEREAHGRRRER